MTSLRSLIAAALLSVACLVSNSAAFVPTGHHHLMTTTKTATRATTMGPLFIELEKERNALTRDSEPEEFFKTNTDKMSDEEKLPIALLGLAGISLPFILGLIALYAARF